ncbi:receptor-like protein kinase FERONIA isoform X1 [Cornus florida]|uniref:receptor-like protein kinase FERONIA isoform X1 n=1 Tax=Cornus florida TaxID=4283 RepID=UPI00289704EC|nr:receptor-like protein kinase FERONIA isoform X1 [Cornus florida]
MKILATITTIYLFFQYHLRFIVSSNSISPYRPLDDFALNCGSTGNSFAFDGREWIGDITNSKFTSSQVLKGKSTSSKTIHQSLFVDLVPYMTARISRSQFTYTFQLRPGQKFIRLHFLPASYHGFDRSKALFTVKAGPYTLLDNFSASLAADALGVKYFAKEFCVNIEQNQVFSITFSPSTSSATDDDVYAFINGIEVVSMPTGLYYSPGDDLGARVVGNKFRYYIDNSTALEMVYRLNVGGRSTLSVEEDLDMYRVWSEDKNYLLQSGVLSVTSTTKAVIKYANIPTYTAPMKVYRTSWSMGQNKVADQMHNLTWKLPVDLGFRYLVRLHFCELESTTTESGSPREFSIFINNQIAETNADVVKWSGGYGVALYRDYVVKIEGNKFEGKHNLIVALQPQHDSDADPILNGIETFKLANPDNILAGPNPAPTAHSCRSQPLHGKLVLAFGSHNVITTGVILILTLLNIIVYQLNTWGSNSGEKNLSSSTLSKEGVCRRFSFAEIQLATNNFGDEFIIGKGGFGNVYKGLINNGTKTVAIKRLKSESKQGFVEFWMEIETLSTIRHDHLVSLIGYYEDSQEMLLVYEYMDNGSLADHLYQARRKGDVNSPLSWEQRLIICIGAARGLAYLHTSRDAHHGVIHRDVKSSNILLDKNWEAKISDFGLSKMDNAGQSQTHISTAVKGTFGYFDPEYFFTCRLTKKSDVYAFGVVLFEVLCERPAVDVRLEEEQHSLAQWAKHCIREGTLDRIVDPSVREQISPSCLKVFAEIATKCLHNNPNERLTMAGVVAGLEYSFSVASGGDEVYPTGQILPTHNLRIFTFAELKAATRNFGADTVLGEGCFGKVYKGRLDERATSKNGSGMVIAVKKLRSDSMQGFVEWKSEVNFLGRLSHPNLIKLLGYCREGEELLLVYEFMQKGNLDNHLFRRGSDVQSLPWGIRLKILVGAARGLEFLHTAGKQVIYRDFKTANILLDASYNAKISDFGLAKLGPSEGNSHVSTRVMGTNGYADPEYIATGRLCVKSDVYGFGVVLVEMLTGLRVVDRNRPTGQHNLVHWIKPRLCNRRKLKGIMDSRFEGKYPSRAATQMAQLALRCLHRDPKERPSMKEVVENLELIEAINEKPKI